jgi:hypothetical protein
MSGMERSFTERLQAMGYSDKATFDRDVERSERELLAWQEIFKMLQDTYGRWHIEPATKDVVFESEVETAQFKMLLSRVTAR